MITLQDNEQSSVDPTKYRMFRKRETKYDKSTDYFIRGETAGDYELFEYPNNMQKRDEDYNKLVNAHNSKGEFKMIKNLKEYFNKHQDIIITVAVIVILDQVMFNGAFRERLQKLFENMLGSVEKKITNQEA